MSIGGRASNDGVSFISNNFTASFVMDKDNNYKISTGKRVKIDNKIRSYIKSIPLIKGLYSLFEGNRLMIVIILLSLLNDYVFHKSKEGQLNNTYMILSLVISIVMIICSAYIIKKTFYKIKNTWRFHGAEHKTIYAYENEMALTLKNVRKCPRIAKRCGTNLTVFMISIYIALTFFIDYSSIRLIFSWVLAYELFDIENGDTIPIINIFFKFGYWCQQKIFTIEPTDIQLIASIETVNKLIELEHGLDNN